MIDIATLPCLSLSERALLPDCSALYFAIAEDGQVLYVGRARSLVKRWKSHERKSQLVGFGNIRIAWLEARKGIVSLERKYIRLLDPPLNWSDQVPRGKYQTISIQVRLPLAVVKWLRSKYLKKGWGSTSKEAQFIIGQAYLKANQEQAA